MHHTFGTFLKFNRKIVKRDKAHMTVHFPGLIQALQ